LLGVDLGVRSCGDVDTPAKTPYMFVTLKEDLYVTATKSLVLTGGQDNIVSINSEALCIYSRKRSCMDSLTVDGTIGTFLSPFFVDIFVFVCKHGTSPHSRHIF
jgi:hypothetical protein